MKPTIDGTKCRNHNLPSSGTLRGGLGRDKRQNQRNQQISDRSFGFQTNGWNNYQWNVPSNQGYYQNQQNNGYRNYNTYNPRNFPHYPNHSPWYPPQTARPWYPPRNAEPTTLYMTTTRPTRRPNFRRTVPYIRRTRPTQNSPSSTRNPNPGRPGRQHHMIIPINNGEFKSCSADSFGEFDIAEAMKMIFSFSHGAFKSATPPRYKCKEFLHAQLWCWKERSLTIRSK